MTKIKLFSILTMIFIISGAYASPMTYEFSNPSFSGNGWSSHVLTIENIENTRKQKIIDDKKAAAAQAASDAKNTNLSKFLNNLESRIYATLSQKIAEQLFTSGGATSGSFDVAGNHIEWSSTGSDISLTITDSGGVTTSIDVPIGSLAW
jgi:hypothetical protein